MYVVLNYQLNAFIYKFSVQTNWLVINPLILCSFTTFSSIWQFYFTVKIFVTFLLIVYLCLCCNKSKLHHKWFLLYPCRFFYLGRIARILSKYIYPSMAHSLEAVGGDTSLNTHWAYALVKCRSFHNHDFITLFSNDFICLLFCHVVVFSSL